MTVDSRFAMSRLSLTILSIVATISSSDALLASRPGIVSHWAVLPSLSPHPSSQSALLASSSISSQQSKKKTSTSNKKKNAKSSPHPKSSRKVGPGRSLTQEELSDHVSARYIANRHDCTTLQELEEDDDDTMTTSSSSFMETAEQSEYLKELNRRPALVLNADYLPLSYLPLSLWSWQDAVKAIFSGKVQVVDVYPDVSVRAASLEVPLPSVIALTDYVAHKNQRPAFTRRNVFLRDEYKCQYCNDRFHTADLSLDHVTPRCMGGQLTWENAVTSCLKCNGRKGSIPLRQLPTVGMRLIREPKCPTQMELAAKAARMVPRRVHPTWKPYLGIAEKPTHHGSIPTMAGGDEEYIDDRYFEESDD